MNLIIRGATPPAVWAQWLAQYDLEIYTNKALLMRLFVEYMASDRIWYYEG